MKLKMIGTGSMYTKYNSACALIDNKVIVDMPNGTVKQLLKTDFDLANIKVILVTHMHGDHTADIPFFFKNIFNVQKRKEEIIVIGPQGIKKQIEALSDAYRFEDATEQQNFFNIKYVELLNDTVSILGYEIESFEVIHGEEHPALGYVINHTLGFTGDSSLCSGVEEIFTQASHIVADSSFIVGNNCHMGLDNLEYLNQKYHKRIIPTHLNDRTREELVLKKYDFIKLLTDFDEITMEKKEN